MLLACSRKLCYKSIRSRFCSFVFDRYKNSFVIYGNNVDTSEVISRSIVQCRVCSVIARYRNKSSQKQNEPKMISIPDKVHRSPTALLEALSETVGEDPTGHGWDFIDDPFLLPYTEKDREDYKAAHHFGEAAADMVFRNMPQLFTMDTAIPKIEQFYPHPFHIEAKGGIGLLNSSGWHDSFDYEEDKIDQIAESYSLDEKIEYFTLTRKVEEAIKYFESLSEDQKSSLSQEALSQLFTLLAYFGNVDRKPTPLPVAIVSSIPAAEKLNPSDDVIQTIDQLANAPSESQAETPNMDETCLARQIFDMLEPKTASHYAAMIKSLARFGRKSEAYFLYEQQLKTGMQFDVTVYNDVILCWDSTGDTFGVTYPEYITGVLTQMRDRGVSPDANTFNSVLKGIENAECCEKLLLPTMREMEVLGVKPSLAVYANFLRLAISTRTRAFKNARPSGKYIPLETIVAVLQRALNEHADIETSIGQSSLQEIPHVDSFGFLQMAMTAVLITGRLNLFDTVHEFAQKNAVLLKMEFDRSGYFKKYLQVISRFSDSSDWMDRFLAVVPSKFTPTVNMLIVDVLPEIDQRQRYDCLPKIWSILKLCNYAMRSQLLLNNFCALLNNKCEVPKYNMTNAQKVDIADDVCDILDTVSETANSSRRRSGDKKPVKLNSELLRYLLDVYISTRQVTKAASLFTAGTRMITNVRTTAFADIVETFWEENLPAEAESFCMECIDNISPQSGKVPELVDIFKDQFSSGMPPKIIKQMEDGFISEEDLKLMQQTAMDTIDMVVAYSQRHSVN